MYAAEEREKMFQSEYTFERKCVKTKKKINREIVWFVHFHLKPLHKKQEILNSGRLGWEREAEKAAWEKKQVPKIKHEVRLM